jgi:pyruvate,orthophosphate dikinase
MRWADKHRTLGVRANADTPADAARAREFGAEGIGLCRTEHMFLEGDRIRCDARDDPRVDTEQERAGTREAAARTSEDDFMGCSRR